MTTDIGLKYFSRAELACKETGVLKLADGFGPWIDSIRMCWGKPLKPTSCCRSLEYNAKVGGAKNSFHIYNHPDRAYGTCAIDFAMIEAEERRNFVKMLLGPPVVNGQFLAVG
jgi:hypothetical protein